MHMRASAALLFVALFAAGCTTGEGDADRGTASEGVPTEGTTPASTPALDAPAPVASDTPAPAPPAPPVPEGQVDDFLASALSELMETLFVHQDPERMAGIELIGQIGRSGDARVAWVLVDSLRFLPPFDGRVDALSEALSNLTGVEFADEPLWVAASDQLLKWDLPAPPGYVEWKRVPFESRDERWRPFFDDPGATFDYRYLSWGGVRVDDRSPAAASAGELCLGCILALRDPGITNADGGRWYPDDAIVFGLVVGGEARAYPKNIMEVHELVTDTVGGRRVSIPYCTLCGSAQAYFVDQLPPGIERIELRTSGLLTRSNKVMFDLHSYSAFDTFTGVAVSGPLREAGFALVQTSIVTSTWGDWKAAHPETTIIAEDGGFGSSYPLDPLGGRDDHGPIFPIGSVDPRLPIQELVLGVEAQGDVRVAFPVAAARLTLEGGESAELGGVTLVADGGGLRATDAGGSELVSHEAFWFAWSQFWPDTLLWTGQTD